MPIRTTGKGWVLETETMGYALGLNESGLLVHCYWGLRLPRVEDYPAAPEPEAWASFNSPSHLTPEEYPAYADMKFIDPCLKASFGDGTRDTVLRFVRAEITQGDAPELVLHLRDATFPLSLALHYRVHNDYDLVERFVTLTNEGAGHIMIERVWSAQWHLPRGEGYRLTHMAGRWFDEMNICRETLQPGIKTLESRRLTTSHHHNPSFAVDRGDAGEDVGDVWFGALGWSGNWKLSAEVTHFASTRVSIGLNDWDFAWRLEGGETFTTPSSFGGYTARGFGDMSRRLHDFIRDTVLPHGHLPHKVLYNSWEATTFDVDETSQARLAELAAGMGVELFVMDDGWFHGRKTDDAGLGDWWPDRTKFPNGLNPLIERVNALGLDFGLWVEPEMVNPDSDLYRATRTG